MINFFFLIIILNPLYSFYQGKVRHSDCVKLYTPNLTIQFCLDCLLIWICWCFFRVEESPWSLTSPSHAGSRNYNQYDFMCFFYEDESHEIIHGSTSILCQHKFWCYELYGCGVVGPLTNSIISIPTHFNYP